MLGKKRKKNELEDVRADAASAIVDTFFIYDEDHKVYKFNSSSECVAEEFMEALLDFIVDKGYSPTLTELANHELLSV